MHVLYICVKGFDIAGVFTMFYYDIKLALNDATLELNKFLIPTSFV